MIADFVIRNKYLRGRGRVENTNFPEGARFLEWFCLVRRFEEVERNATQKQPPRRWRCVVCSGTDDFLGCELAESFGETNDRAGSPCLR